MQKETITEYPLTYAPIGLADDFPIAGGQVQVKRDGPIRHLHRHNCLEIGYCYGGSGLLVIGNRTLPFGAGTATVISANRDHFSSNAPNTESRWSWLMLDPAGLLAGFAPAASEYVDCSRFCGESVFPADRFADVSAMVRDLNAELRGQQDGYRCAVRSRVLTLLIHLARLAPPSEARGGEPPRNGHRVFPALEHISNHYSEPINVDDLARRCHVCTVHFRRLFRQATGLLPHEYIARHRIRMAECLLRSGDRPILDIAMSVGFQSLSSFNRQFRKLNGVAPRVWRNG